MTLIDEIYPICLLLVYSVVMYLFFFRDKPYNQWIAYRMDQARKSRNRGYYCDGSCLIHA